MAKKSGNFFEAHIEKIVFGIVGVMCVWVLATRIVISPNYVRYEDRRFGSGQVDNYVRRQAEHLNDKLSRPPSRAEPYPERVGDFIAKMESAVSNIDVSIYPPVPAVGSAEIADDSKYSLPQVGRVDDVEVGHIRTVAYVPVEEVYEQKPYEQARNEPNDIDLVTVSGKFDVGRLYERFYESFAGRGLPEDWRDPCLAEPVFAAVELQRQHQLPDGSWSQWRIVPRSKTDHRRATFRITEEVDELPPGGVKVRLLQFDNAAVRADLLQPGAYQIASAEEEWFPPSLHKKYVQRRKEMMVQERRRARETEKQERERELGRAREERVARRAAERLEVSDESGGAFDESKSGSVSARRTQPRKTRRERLSERGKERSGRSKETAGAISTIDIYEELDSILIITAETDFGRASEAVTFWSHDDTVEPGRAYRYRMRLGVFNPIAGTDRFAEQDKHLRNQVVLWSEFSDVTEPVEVPEVLYFFATDSHAATSVTVTVYQYVLGYWYVRAFLVSAGEMIGKVTEYESGEAEANVTVPETIDYTTGAILVDIVAVNDWSSERTLRSRSYVDMLYSFDGVNVERMPVRKRYWADSAQRKFNEIRRLEKEPKQPWRAWGVRAGQVQRRVPGAEGTERDYDIDY